MTIVIFHRLASRDLRSAYHWYFKRNPRAAERFRHAVVTAVQKIRDNPTLAPPDADDTRWVKTERYPYLLHYLITPNQSVLVLAVAHSRRRPVYWRRRRNRP